VKAQKFNLLTLVDALGVRN